MSQQFNMVAKIKKCIFFVSIFALLTAFTPMLTCAASLFVRITDSVGTSVENAVVYAEPVSGGALPKPSRNTEIAQVNRQFDPLVTVVQTGTEINFPNKDVIKHHVYSFSSAKAFDLPLYSGKPSSAQLFNKPGTVVLGCNIHDKMIAYVHVVDTPYFGKTNSKGQVNIDGLNSGNYVIKAWHYKLPPLDQVVEKKVSILDKENHVEFELNLIK